MPNLVEPALNFREFCGLNESCQAFLLPKIQRVLSNLPLQGSENLVLNLTPKFLEMVLLFFSV